MFDRRRFIRAGVATGTLAAAGTLALPAAAQREAGRILVGFAPGGAADVVARAIANKIASDGAPYLVDNRAGAGGRLAAGLLKSAAADGRTLLVTPDSVMGIYPHVYRNLGYDPLTDYRAVSLLTTVPLGLAVGPMVPASVRTPADFVQWCKANPDKSSFGTAGAGSPLHFLGAIFARAYGFNFVHVPFRGGALAAQDVMGGQIAASINVISELVPMVLSGKVRLLAVSGPARSRYLPDVPSFRETGFTEADFLAWFGLFAPARTPDAVVDQLQRSAAAALALPDTREALSKLSFEVVASSPQQLQQTVQADVARWGPVVKASGYVAQD